MLEARVLTDTSRLVSLQLQNGFELIKLCFQVFDDKASKYTYAGVLTEPSRTTPVFARFSTVQGSRGSAVSSAYTRIYRQVLPF